MNPMSVDGASRIPRQTYPRARRLLHARDYQRVFAETQVRASNRHLLLLARINEESFHRLGLVLAKKNVKLAVQRNRIKRLAREFFRLLQTEIPCLDIVLLARPGLGELSKQQFTQLLGRQWVVLRKNLPADLHTTRKE